MTKVLIVSRTLMHPDHCIGGLRREDATPVRLCPADLVHGLPPDAPYEVGQVWELDLAVPTHVRRPHVEDMIVRGGRRIAVQTGMRRYLTGRVEVWRGGPEVLFGGALSFTSSGRGRVIDASSTPGSVGFWKPASDLVLGGDRVYRYDEGGGARTIKYVGVKDPDLTIPAGSLVRVSLSRAFAPPGGTPGFWLQLSGWYPD